MSPSEIVHTMLSNDAFSQWLGIELVHIDHGTCTLSLTVRAEMLNGFGIAHGGITYALADSALAFAANSHGRQSVSIDTSINHVETLKVGDVITATATEEALKNRFGFYAVAITKNETTVALFKGTVFRSEREW
ncbi:PaaI family thioesterase [Flavobacterium sp.]|jgi:acyl-CoA thioesterase|uniref:PaaI family thioesterase n=1 Tax=Flavobacterium sp. TaxID=239 RepID=UPI0022BEFABF|nr:hotdog fold thioesterase [Flavobacterium sp.]MCZ8169014.1 hotdog fold thioesterase [Flavobacterium sp.]MCZ8297190.1 hotdog fold thioesterase [Flavobacterium sp.]